MKKSSFKSKYWTLGIGFGVIIILMIILEIVSIKKSQSLAELTSKLYNHPHTVSNSVLIVHAKIISIHRYMKDVVLAKNSSELESAISKVKDEEAIVHQQFEIILERFLGDKSRISKAHDAFEQWREIRSEVIELRRQSRFDEAAAITKGKGAEKVARLTKEIEGLVSFAQNKAEEFLNNSVKQQDEFNVFIYSLFVVIVLSVISVALFVIYRLNVMDIELKKSQEQLFISKKMDAIGQLTGGIAHDYNNILGVVMGYAHLLRTQPITEDKLKKYAEKIYHASERGSKLTKKLLSLTKKLATEAVEVNVNEVLLQEQDLLQKSLTVRIKLVYELDKELWLSYLDVSELEDVILNLTVNAIYAMNDMEGSPSLTVRSRNQSLSEIAAQNLGLEAGDYVQISFTDTGCGMTSMVKERLFEPFFSTKGNKGTGLGLSQVFAFVKRSKGAIEVFSDLGHGSDFVLYFPRYNQSTVEQLETYQAENLQWTGNEKILVVDDEKELLHITDTQLSKKGYKVYCAESAKEAIEILNELPINLMISDVIMPEMDGYQLASYVDKHYPKTKIIMCSGFSEIRSLTMVEEHLNKNSLTKPVNVTTLYRTVRNLLDS